MPMLQILAGHYSQLPKPNRKLGAGVQAYIGPPTLPARYEMLRSSVQELCRVKIVTGKRRGEGRGLRRGVTGPQKNTKCSSVAGWGAGLWGMVRTARTALHRGFATLMFTCRHFESWKNISETHASPHPYCRDLGTLPFLPSPPAPPIPRQKTCPNSSCRTPRQ